VHSYLQLVMAGLVPAIHVAPHTPDDVDARAFAAPKRLRPRRQDKPGHDETLIGSLDAAHVRAMI
jgi:hypothetical protein